MSCFPYGPWMTCEKTQLTPDAEMPPSSQDVAVPVLTVCFGKNVAPSSGAALI